MIPHDTQPKNLSMHHQSLLSPVGLTTDETKQLHQLAQAHCTRGAFPSQLEGTVNLLNS